MDRASIKRAMEDGGAHILRAINKVMPDRVDTRMSVEMSYVVGITAMELGFRCRGAKEAFGILGDIAYVRFHSDERITFWISERAPVEVTQAILEPLDDLLKQLMWMRSDFESGWGRV